MGRSNYAISAELQAAQQRLYQLRAKLQKSRNGVAEQQNSLFDSEDSVQRPFPTPQTIAQLPPHLGWNSTAVTQTIRREARQAELDKHAETVSVETAVSQSPTYPKTIKLYPDIGIGMLRKELVAAGRLWLLLQTASQSRCGWVAEDRARQLFTSKRGKLRFCGSRQLRNLLAQGDGLFWARENGRIWLKSAAKVAFALDIPRLKMRPVALPVSVLRQKIGAVRAHFYASFHSSRTQSGQTNKPISRETVSQLTQVQPRTQRRYERAAKVKRQAQYAIGSQVTSDHLQARSWEQGHATFQFKDFNGQQGPQGKRYVAWQLPNSYVGPHAQQPKGRQKRINRTLTDLFMQGMTGNGQRPSVARRFFENGRLAAKSYVRNSEQDHYWPGSGNGRFQLWHVMENCNLK